MIIVNAIFGILLSFVYLGMLLLLVRGLCALAVFLFGNKYENMG